MGDFTTDQIAELYDQHTQATDQAFTKGSVDQVFGLTQGQPWQERGDFDQATTPSGRQVTVLRV